MTAIEHQQLKGLTVKNFIVTIVSTASIVVSVMTTYFGLKSDISDVKAQNEVRMKALEIEVSFLQAEMVELKKAQK